MGTTGVRTSRWHDRAKAALGALPAVQVWRDTWMERERVAAVWGSVAAVTKKLLEATNGGSHRYERSKKLLHESPGRREIS